MRRSSPGQAGRRECEGQVKASVWFGRRAGRRNIAYIQRRGRVAADGTQVFSIVAAQRQVFPVQIRNSLRNSRVESLRNSAIIRGMKSPLNRGGLRFYLVIIALVCRHPAGPHDQPPLDSRRPAMPNSGGLAAHLGQGLSAAEPRRRHDRAVSLRAAPVLPGQRPDRRRAGGDGRLVAAGRRAAAVVAGDLSSRDSRRGTLPYGEFSGRVSGV